MAAEGNTPMEIEEWIIKVINSCTTVGQIVKSRRLIDLYWQKMTNETELCWEVRRHLKDKMIEHYKNTKLELIKNRE